MFFKVFGIMWPGNGTVYLSQNMDFIKPMYAGEKYLAKFSVIKAFPKNKFSVRTIVLNANGEKTIEGNAVIRCDNSPAPKGFQV